jgi:hypothetical protein
MLSGDRQKEKKKKREYNRSGTSMNYNLNQQKVSF